MKIKTALTSKVVKEYVFITVSTLIVVVGLYFFKFPDNFTFGGVTGLAIVLAKITPITPATINLILNIILLILGFAFLGKNFGVKTIYSSMLLSISLSVLEQICPMHKPLTNEPMLDLAFAVALPAFGCALLFHVGASSGGTDIIAMILKKHSSLDIGRALFLSDLLITLSAFFVFDIKTVLFSFLGLMAKSLVIDNVIESINLCKYFNVICSNPDLICNFIVTKLKRGATICEAKGAYSHSHKYIIYVALRRPQAIQLQQYIKSVEPDAFILITNTSEIIGKGFHD